MSFEDLYRAKCTEYEREWRTARHYETALRAHGLQHVVDMVRQQVDLEMHPEVLSD